MNGLASFSVPDAPEGLSEEPAEVIMAWASGRYQRYRDQIWLVCEQLLLQGVAIVIDGTAVNKKQRAIIREKATDNNVDFHLYYVTSDSETRRKRVLERNTEKGRSFSIEVTHKIFDYIETFFEPPTDEELIGASIIET